jgi:hypothetical protein
VKGMDFLFFISQTFHTGHLNHDFQNKRKQHLPNFTAVLLEQPRRIMLLIWFPDLMFVEADQ